MRFRFALVAIAAALIAGNASASLPTPGSTLIVQQRTADGSILLTDRPVAGAPIERSWSAWGAAPAASSEREGLEPAVYRARLPRHIDARWRAIEDDPVRDYVVRVTLERERSQRPMQRAWLPAREHALRGPAAPGNR